METALQLAVRRYPDAAARSTELVAHGGDQPHSPHGSRQTVPPRHAIGFDFFQRRESVQNLRYRQKAFLWPCRTGPHRHQFNEPHLPGVLFRQAQKILDLVIVHAAHQHGVQLQILKSGILRCPDARKGVLQISTTGDFPESLRPQGVQTDVQPVHSGFLQGLCQFRQQAAVGGEAKLLQFRDGPQRSADVQNPSPHQRFSAGQTDLPDPQLHRSPGDLAVFLYGEDGPVRAFFHAVRRHTVLASVIAKVRYRQPQIINCPAILIDHRITSYRPKLRPGISPGVFAGGTRPAAASGRQVF